MGLIFGILKLIIYITIFAAVIVFIPNLPPYTSFSTIPIEPTQPRVGPLAPNGVLNKAERLYAGKLWGPEAFQVHKGELYTGLASGEIVKLNPGGHVTFFAKLGFPCTGISQEPRCGRPLGFEFDETNNLMYVADAYHGIWKIDLYNDKKQLVISPRAAIKGHAPKLFNFLALAKNGDFYWSDSSIDFNLQNGVMISLADPSGRLLHYNAANNQSTVLLDNLWFANGVAISPDNQFVVVAESFRYRLVKYYIAGPKKGKSEVFVAGLPGAPDNVRVLPNGYGLLISLFTSFDEENPFLARSMAETPLVRKFLARVIRLIEIPFEYLNTIYPHFFLEEMVAYIGNFRSLESAVPQQSGLVVVDWNGNIVESYFNTDGTLVTISDAIIWNNKLITGGPHQNFMGSAPIPQLLKKAFDSKIESAPKQKPAEVVKPKVEVKREAQKPVVQEKQAKPAAAKPVEQPKPAAAKPAQQTKPAATKPVEQTKPAATKPVEQTKPAATKPVEQTKPAAVKPKEQPKQTPPPKPVEQPKQTPKPVEQAKPAAAAKPKEQTKPTTGKPVEQPRQPEQKPVPTKPEPVKASKQDKPSPKAQEKAPVKKSAETKSNPATKPVEPEPEFIVTRPKEEALKEMKNKLAPENIPIREEIPSDTAKPSKETLKVIKKGGPAEIPNPHL